MILQGKPKMISISQQNVKIPQFVYNFIYINSTGHVQQCTKVCNANRIQQMCDSEWDIDSILCTYLQPGKNIINSHLSGKFSKSERINRSRIYFVTSKSLKLMVNHLYLVFLFFTVIIFNQQTKQCNLAYALNRKQHVGNQSN